MPGKAFADYLNNFLFSILNNAANIAILFLHVQFINFFNVKFHSSLTDIPAVETSQMAEDLGVLLEEANEFDLIHDVTLQVKC